MSQQVGGRRGERETFLLIFLAFLAYVTAQGIIRTEPVNIGLICALPWDISNTLRAPLGGPISLLLTAFMACILFFGLLLSPVHYFLGYPSRIYHPARRPGIISEVLYDRRSLEGYTTSPATDVMDIFTLVNRSIEHHEQRMISDEDNIQQQQSDEATSSQSRWLPDFVNGAFLFIPESDNECRKLIVCHAHGFLQIVPTKLTRILRLFSKRMMHIPEEYRSAVVAGLTDHATCKGLYRCSKEMSSILKDVLMKLIPEDTKAAWNLSKLY